MVIAATTANFPQNVIEVMVPRLRSLDADLAVLRRAIRPTDPVQSVGVYCDKITPNENSYEMRGLGAASIQSLATLTYRIQAYNKHSDEIEGLGINAELTERVRDMLYDDATFRIGLQPLTATRPNGKLKRLTRYMVKDTDYMQQQLAGDWTFLSVTTFEVEVETA